MASRPLQIKRVTPEYWEEACRHLAKKDRVMRRLIPQFGDACLESRGDALSPWPEASWDSKFPSRPRNRCGTNSRLCAKA
jgi:hypothetical protein